MGCSALDRAACFYVMKRFLSLFYILLFFLFFFLSQNGYAPALSFIMFVPLLYSLYVDEKRGLAGSILRCATVFFLGAVYVVFNYYWLSIFYSFALLFAAVVFSLEHFFFPYAILVIFSRKFKSRIMFVVFFAALWTVMEFAFQRIPFPFPYGSIALGFFRTNVLLQILDLFGQSGITFLLAFVNGLLFLAIDSFRKNRLAGLRYLSVALSVLILWLGYGLISPLLLKSDKDIYVDLAQSSISGKDKADMDLVEYETYIGKFFSMYSNESGIIIFPETFFYADISDSDEPLRQFLERASKKQNVTVAGGFIQNTPGGIYPKTNSFFVLEPDGSFSVSQKKVLAPFGEYYPFGSLFPGLRETLENRRGAFFFNRGEGPEPLSYKADGETFSLRAMICYEAAFPSLLRGAGPSNTDYLLSISSDYWTHSRRAMLQNAMYAKLRAIEFRLPVVRVSNGGLTMLINAAGKTWYPLPAFAEGNGHIWIVKHRHSLYRNRTPYSFWGDIIVYVCFAFLTYSVIVLLTFKRKKVRQ